MTQRHRTKGQRKCEQRYEKSARGRYRRYKDDARSKGHRFAISLAYFDTLINQVCTYCGSKDPRKLNGIDRVDNRRGYIRGNVVSCCTDCNFAKRIRSKEDFIDHCIKVAEYQKSLNRT